MKLKHLSIIGILLFLTGCMSVNQEMLRKVSISPPEKRGTTVELKTGDLVQKLNGEGQNRGVLSGTTVLNAIGKSMMQRWENKDIIADYGFSGELKKDPDYTITLSGVRNEDGSIAGAVFSGLTLMLLPTSSTLTYDINLEFINNHTQKHYTVKAKNAVTTWMQIFLFPALPFSWIGGDNMINDIADYSYDELRKQGAFSDSQTLKTSTANPERVQTAAPIVTTENNISENKTAAPMAFTTKAIEKPKTTSATVINSKLIEKIQTALTSDHYYHGNINGELNEDTRNAIAVYKEINNLSGKSIDKAFLNALGIDN